MAETGNGVALKPGSKALVAPLAAECAERNAKLLSRFREDPFAEELFNQTREDAALGRMTDPIPIEKLHTRSVMLASRSSVVQGVRSSGELKLRAVDDESCWAQPILHPRREIEGSRHRSPSRPG